MFAVWVVLSGNNSPDFSFHIVLLEILDENQFAFLLGSRTIILHLTNRNFSLGKP